MRAAERRFAETAGRPPRMTRMDGRGQLPRRGNGHTRIPCGGWTTVFRAPQSPRTHRSAASHIGKTRPPLPGPGRSKKSRVSRKPTRNQFPTGKWFRNATRRRRFHGNPIFSAGKMRRCLPFTKTHQTRRGRPIRGVTIGADGTSATNPMTPTSTDMRRR